MEFSKYSNKGHADEKKYFAQLVRELSEAFKPRGWLLSSAVSPSKTVIDAGYEVPTLSKHFDWVAVMCYDYHGQWDKKTGTLKQEENETSNEKLSKKLQIIAQ